VCVCWGSVRICAGGQAHRKHRTLARLACYCHIAAHHPRELARDSEPEPRSPEALSGRGIGLAELLEQLCLLLRGHPDAGAGREWRCLIAEEWRGALAGAAPGRLSDNAAKSLLRCLTRLAGSGEALTSGTDAARFQTLNGGVKPSDAPTLDCVSKARAWGFFGAGVVDQQ
jgi:hypothetical protein